MAHPDQVTDSRTRRFDGRWFDGRWALAGLVSGLSAVGVAQILAGVIAPSSAPLIAVGNAFVDRVPGWLKTTAISLFGTHDKQVLIGGAVVVLALISATAGLVARRRPAPAQWIVLGLGALAALAAATRPDATMLSPLPSLVGAVAGAFALTYVTARLRPHSSSLSRENAAAQPDRRAFLAASGMVAAGGAAGLAAGQLLGQNVHGADTSRAKVTLPAPATPEPALPEGVEVGVPGVVPFRVPNSSFYRIDTALIVPSVKADSWKLRIHGMVDHEVTIDYPTLTRSALVEKDVTLICVSNEVGGDLVGNARWLGLPLGPLLKQAGLHADADMVLSTSADGWTCSTPLDVLTDGRDALLAIGMNGEPLPVAHGFPVRMVVPGLYGFVSATKWVVDLEVTRFDRAQGYWTSRGWSAKAPVKTQSRIDVPHAGDRVRAGTVAVAGIAWAQHRGITGVQVQVDGGAWQDARLGAQASLDTWRQWVFPWTATPGPHSLIVRAIDRTGQPQTDQTAPPDPDGATGLHRVDVTVT